jgi:FkbM family methyltransferase
VGVPRLYPALRALYQIVLFAWFTRRVGRWFLTTIYTGALAPLLPLAGTWRERWSVLGYVLQWMLIVHKILPHWLRPLLPAEVVVRVQGVTQVMGVESCEAFILVEIYRDHVYEQVADFVPTAGWVVLDVGANAGVFTVQQARRGAQVVAIEPNPTCYARLRRAVRANQLQDAVRLFNCALGAAEGQGILCADRGLTTLGTILPLTEGTATHTTAREPGITVPLTTLDALVPTLAIEQIDLLKIDTEGAEAAILQGAAQTLDRVQRVVLEYHSAALLEQTRALLGNHGFTEVLQVEGDPQSRLGILYAARCQQG